MVLKGHEQTMATNCTCRLPILLAGILASGCPVAAEESPYIYGIFGYDLTTGVDDRPWPFLDRITNGAGPGWVTTTVALCCDPLPQADYTGLSSRGHTVICRLNYGYFPDGTIPLPAAYDDFATRCSNFVARTPGCSIWTVGNELNIQGEWPYDPVAGRMTYVTPANYATCFRKVYNAIKAIRPNDKVLPAAPACFSGPLSAGFIGTWNGTNYYADALPLNWVDHLNAVLTAIKSTGPLDGIARSLSFLIVNLIFNPFL